MSEKTDKEILEELEEAWEDVQDNHEIELSPKAINWMIEKLQEYIGC